MDEYDESDDGTISGDLDSSEGEEEGEDEIEEEVDEAEMPKEVLAKLQR